MRTCVMCQESFANFGREICCSIKCKILEGKQIIENGCWIYKKSASGAYGKVRWKMKWYSAHRCSYEAFVGPIEDKKWVCHKCDTPKCVNPEHLFLGSPSENMRNAVNKKRAALGENNHFSRFTDEQVEEIRSLKDEGFTYARLVRIFNCSVTYLVKIIKNKIRKE